MLTSFLILLLLIVYAWPDLVVWLGVWPVFILSWLILSFPLGCMVGEFIRRGRDGS